MIGAYLVERWYRKRQVQLVAANPQLAVFSFDIIASTIAFDGRYEAPELDYLSTALFPTLKSRRVCLDVGANIGNHSICFADHFEQVFSFEPHPRTFKLLEANAMLRQNIVPVNSGASSSKQQLEARYNPRNMGSASVENRVWEEKTSEKNKRTDSQVLELDRLDSLVPAALHNRIDFMKVDVEGHEFDALEGAKQIIASSRPVIAIELSGGVDAITKSVGKLRDFGYNRFEAPTRDTARDSTSEKLSEFVTRLRGKRRALSLSKISDFTQGDYPFVIAQHAGTSAP